MITQAMIEKAFSALYQIRGCKPPRRGTRKRAAQMADVAAVLRAVEFRSRSGSARASFGEVSEELGATEEDGMKKDDRGSTVSGFSVEDYEHLHKAGDLEAEINAFVTESNKIEGIHRLPTDAEVKAHKTLIARKRVKIEHVTALVAVCQPNAVLRATTNIHGVRVGNHIAPPSGPSIVASFDKLLADIATKAIIPWAAHVQYETLHPYTDGNGRSGRAVWLWQMTLLGQQQRALALGFLHSFYYQTLAANH